VGAERAAVSYGGRPVREPFVSQPGELAEFHGRPWRQRAVFAAFVADPERARALAAQAAEAGLAVRAYPPGRRVAENGERDAVDVTFWEGRGVMTGLGNRMSPRVICRTFRVPRAVRRLRTSSSG
jgi:hypothetical protein